MLAHRNKSSVSPTFKSLGVVDRCASLAVTVRKDVTDMTSTRFDWSWSSLKLKREGGLINDSKDTDSFLGKRSYNIV